MVDYKRKYPRTNDKVGFKTFRDDVAAVETGPNILLQNWHMFKLRVAF